MHGQSIQRYVPNYGRRCAVNIRWAKVCWKATTGIWSIRQVSVEYESTRELRLFIIQVSCVFQVFGTTELPEKPIMLPPFVDSTHCLPYYLTRKGRAVADRVVSVLAYVCPDITYSPTIYPIAAILLHFMSGECAQQRLNAHFLNVR